MAVVIARNRAAEARLRSPKQRARRCARVAKSWRMTSMKEHPRAGGGRQFSIHFANGRGVVVTVSDYDFAVGTPGALLREVQGKLREAGVSERIVQEWRAP